MENFTPISALIGGLLIGGAALILMAFNGHIAGITGVLRGILQPKQGDLFWRLAFIGGPIGGPLIYQVAVSTPIASNITSSMPILIADGLLVGFGTTLGSGCTSGHGICGLGRFSKRSLAATMTFMATAAVTVYFAKHILGAAS